jgi:hypothetical protein
MYVKLIRIQCKYTAVFGRMYCIYLQEGRVSRASSRQSFLLPTLSRFSWFAFLLWKWRQYVPPNRRYIFTRLHSTTSMKTGFIMLKMTKSSIQLRWIGFIFSDTCLCKTLRRTDMGGMTGRLRPAPRPQRNEPSVRTVRDASNSPVAFSLPLMALPAM